MNFDLHDTDLHLFPYRIVRIMQRVPAQVMDYGISLVNAPAVWRKTKGQNIRVGILDTGIDRSHPDLKPNIHGGYNFINNTKQFDDDNGHGTHVAGIIAGTDNGVGIVGVAPQAQIYALKVLNNRGVGSDRNIIAGLEWSIINKMDVINLSFGSSKSNAQVRDALVKVKKAGIVAVAAAGNDANKNGTDTVDYPGRWSDLVITVAAVDQHLQRASFSSQGPEVMLAAPGVDILSTYPNNRYVRLSGTSMAAPHVTGVVALLQSYAKAVRNKRFMPDQVRQQLLEHAIDLGQPGRDRNYGYGLIHLA
ncbi:S8 family peptidase [Heliophilum fasciatum]|uniref:Subtilase family protein n=1 Tax=Heliophilum fasciatum TaxID=35700 RepID=A0A4R2RP81_9FIRM|nr:S8 family peptidase [Heliophilum fasciatum]MCW2279206.1 subtilisin [Heliophilum fasciatum]TCP60995.1 subtilase family protein [Heliophilum fasciatum]